MLLFFSCTSVLSYPLLLLNQDAVLPIRRAFMKNRYWCAPYPPRIPPPDVILFDDKRRLKEIEEEK